MKAKQLLTVMAITAFATIAAIDPALAQDAGDAGGGSENWWEPITDLFSVLQTGIGKIGAYVVGFGLCIYGAIGAVTGRLDTNRILIIVFAGVLIASGPTIASKLMG